MKILFLDVYPDVTYRICKDTAGGYGTANDFGDTLFCKIIKRSVKGKLDWPPFHAMYPMGVLKNKGYTVEYSRNVEDYKNYDLIIVPSSIVAHETEIDAIKEIHGSKKPILAIGPFATNYPESYINAGAKVIFGESEMYFMHQDISIEKIKSLGSKIIVKENSDINLLPLPPWDIVCKHLDIKNSFLGKGENTFLPIIATRGCPYVCSYYCTYPLQQGKAVRLREPKKIVEEMIHWQKTLGISSFAFRDPVFSINRKHTLEICKLLDEKNTRFNLLIETHLNNLDDEMIKKLKVVGLKIVYVGIESVDSTVLEGIHRFTISNDEQYKKIRQMEEQGIAVKTMFMLGSKEDTRETCYRSIKYAKKLNSSFAQFCIFTPYPGTPFYAETKDNITSKKLENFNQYQLVFNHPNFSNKQIRRIMAKAYRSYYLNPMWIMRHLLKFIKH